MNNLWTIDVNCSGYEPMKIFSAHFMNNTNFATDNKFFKRIFHTTIKPIKTFDHRWSVTLKLRTFLHSNKLFLMSHVMHPF